MADNTDGITVISQSTIERNHETMELFNLCRPYLDEGYSLSYTVMKLKNYSHRSFTRMRWYKDLKNYAQKQGYYK